MFEVLITILWQQLIVLKIWKYGNWQFNQTKDFDLLVETTPLQKITNYEIK
jgi:hypothetical protein